MHLNANNNVYSNIFSTDQLINMNTFDAMYEDDHNQIEHFMPINSSQEDIGGGGNGSVYPPQTLNPINLPTSKI